ncbi:MAG: hypothetical protein SVW57_15235, partial [Thermodesulfobacteriota bacterium]|nr:hypothetical protein [Thermodesulfobacteriota bacterium]
GIIDFRKVFCGEIWIEIVFCRVVNDDKGEIQRMKEVLENINPDKIQLNTVVRPPADDFAFALNAQQLEDIREMMGEKAEVITVPSRTIMEFGSLSGEEHIVELLRRRPCVLGDISVALGIQQIESIKMINKLMEEEKIEYCVYNHQSFYKIKEGS